MNSKVQNPSDFRRRRKGHPTEKKEKYTFSGDFVKSSHFTSNLTISLLDVKTTNQTSKLSPGCTFTKCKYSVFTHSLLLGLRPLFFAGC